MKKLIFLLILNLILFSLTPSIFASSGSELPTSSGAVIIEEEDNVTSSGAEMESEEKKDETESDTSSGEVITEEENNSSSSGELILEKEEEEDEEVENKDEEEEAVENKNEEEDKTPSIQADFPDVSDAHQYYTAINYVRSKGIVQGYPDGTYKPEQNINRAEFTKIIVGAAMGYNPDNDNAEYDILSTVGLSFSDLGNPAWYNPYLRKAVQQEVINGYPDGTFKPAQNISFVEAAKIIVISFGYPINVDDIWYKPYVLKLEEFKSIPVSIESFTYNITRAEMAEMIYRLMEKIVDKESQTYDDFSEPTGSNQTEFNIPNVDTDRVRSTWMSWFNTERATLGRHNLVYDDRLNSTALEWSKYMVENNNYSHKRPGQTAYYDYNLITSWFKDRGLVFKNVNRVTYSENIGWGYFKCSKEDCTDDLINSIRSTFDFYMNEKGKSSQPHYGSMTNKYFNVMGLGIYVGNGRYGLTVHYGTDIIE